MSGSGKFPIGQEPFRIGVRYWPRREVHDLWRNFDIDEVQQDFSLMAELGINLARVVLAREDFQADPDSLRCSALAHLLELCDAAASEGVRLELLLFADRAGNPAYQPDWQQTHPEPITGPTQEFVSTPSEAREEASTLRAARAMARGVARAVGSHSAVWAFNLGVPAQTAAPSEHREAATAWLDSLQQSIRSVSDKPLLTGIFGGTRLASSEFPRLDQLCAGLDHCTLDRHGFDTPCPAIDPQCSAVFSCALARALTGRPCVLEEMAQGGDSPDSASPFEMLALLHALHRVGALGIVIGAYADLFASEAAQPRSEARGNAELSRRLRPHAEALVSFAQERPLVQRVPLDTLSLGVAVDEYFEHPTAHMNRLYQQFLDGWSGLRP